MRTIKPAPLKKVCVDGKVYWATSRRIYVDEQTDKQLMQLALYYRESLSKVTRRVINAYHKRWRVWYLEKHDKKMKEAQHE